MIEMAFLHLVLLFLAGVIGGALNAVAGGGGFFSFAALLFFGVPAIPANVTSSVALWPGSLASVVAYRRELVGQRRLFVLLVIGSSVIGGIIGAFLLLNIPPSVFESFIPYLQLTGTLLFIFSKFITGKLRLLPTIGTDLSRGSLFTICVLQLVIAIYGGFFGGGISVLILALLAVTGMKDIHIMNGYKVVLASCINGIAVVIFVIAHAVLWPSAIIMLLGAILGGYCGASCARKIEPQRIRHFVVSVSIALTVYFFARPHLEYLSKNVPLVLATVTILGIAVLIAVWVFQQNVVWESDMIGTSQPTMPTCSIVSTSVIEKLIIYMPETRMRMNHTPSIETLKQYKRRQVKRTRYMQGGEYHLAMRKGKSTSNQTHSQH